MRLQSFLSRAGIASRRNVIQELEAGKVKVNGEIVRIPSFPIFPKDRVTYLDRPVGLSSQKLYFLFNKPRGVITTTKDTHGRKTVLDYLKHVKERLYPVGRLDQDTTGLLLLTNDGELANRLMHPRYGVEKVYEAILDREVAKDKLQRIEAGILIEGEKTAPCRIALLPVIASPTKWGEAISRPRDRLCDLGARRLLRPRSERCLAMTTPDAYKSARSKVEITLHEGRKRQIRNMFQAIGVRVLHLHRKRYGILNLKGLAPGKNRPLTPEEIQKLQTLCKLT